MIVHKHVLNFLYVIKSESKFDQYYKHYYNRVFFLSYNHDCVTNCLRFKKVIAIEKNQSPILKVIEHF